MSAEPGLTLYGIATSRAGRCLWMLEELGVPYRHVPIHFNDGSTKKNHAWRIGLAPKCPMSA